MADHDIRTPDRVYYLQGECSTSDGGPTCSCGRCSFTQGAHRGKTVPCKAEAGLLRLVASRLMQKNSDESVAKAVELYGFLGSSHVDPHTIGAAMIESGAAGWRAGLRCWERALEGGSGCDEGARCRIRTELRRAQSYGGVVLLSGLAEGGLGVAYPVYRAQRLNIFVSTQPVFSAVECDAFVAAAEDRCKNGWSSTRHYAVPTTDVPVNEISVLAEFNARLSDVIFPAMVSQFSPAFAEVEGCHLCVHDAFVVKYDEFAQRCLPEHTDQSSHSLIIPLNEDFDGGGTYFSTLGASLRAPKGHVVSFSGGSIAHSGEAVTRGTRYIIAVFVFMEYQIRGCGGHGVKRRFGDVVTDREAFTFSF